MSPITPAAIILWVQVGDQLLRLGESTLDRIRGGSVVDDNEQLDKLDALYVDRISRAEREANRPA